MLLQKASRLTDYDRDRPSARLCLTELPPAAALPPPALGLQVVVLLFLATPLLDLVFFSTGVQQNSSVIDGICIR